MTQANSSAANTLFKSLFGAFSGLFFSNDSEAKPGSQKPPAEVPRPIVLVIDDDLKYLETVRGFFAGSSFRVLTSNCGAKGLDMMRHCRDNLRVVLLDYHMPRLDGVKTLEYARKLHPKAKIIGVIDGD